MLGDSKAGAGTGPISAVGGYQTDNNVPRSVAALVLWSFMWRMLVVVIIIVLPIFFAYRGLSSIFPVLAATAYWRCLWSAIVLINIYLGVVMMQATLEKRHKWFEISVANLYRGMYQVFADAYGRKQVVKEGINWDAMLFTCVWAFAKGMFRCGVVMLLCLGFLLSVALTIWILFPSTATVVLAIILFCSPSVAIGFLANSWRCKFLLSRGYSMSSTVSAPSARDALTMCDKA